MRREGGAPTEARLIRQGEVSPQMEPRAGAARESAGARLVKAFADLRVRLACKRTL